MAPLGRLENPMKTGKFVGVASKESQNRALYPQVFYVLIPITMLNCHVPP